MLLERQPRARAGWSCCLYRVDGDVRRIRVAAGRPLNEARAIARLFAERLAGGAEEEIDAGFGVDLMRLSCLLAEPLAPSQREWERAFEAERAARLADLLDRLSARLGPRRVTRQTLRRCAYSRTGGRRRAGDARRIARAGEGFGPFLSAEAPSRPLRLFERPEPIEAIFWLLRSAYCSVSGLAASASAPAGRSCITRCDRGAVGGDRLNRPRAGRRKSDVGAELAARTTVHPEGFALMTRPHQRGRLCPGFCI